MEDVTESSQPEPDSKPALQSPHDKLIRWAYDKHVVMEGFLRAYATPQVKERGIWQDMRRIPRSYIGDDLVDSHTDLLWALPLRCGDEKDAKAEAAVEEVLIYNLFEHQSNPERFTVFRVGEYKFDIWKDYLKSERPEDEKNRTRHLPRILAFVVHQGEHWPAPTRLRELFRQPQQPNPALQEVEELDLDGAIIPVTIPEGDFRKIQGHIIGRVALALVAAASEERTLEFFAECGEMVEELLQQPDAVGILRVFLKYATEVDATLDSEFPKLLEHIHEPIIKDEIMTLAEQWRESGRREGLLATLPAMFDLKFGAGAAANLSDDLGKLSASTLGNLAAAIQGFSDAAEVAAWIEENADEG